MSEFQTVYQDGIVILNLTGWVDASNSGQFRDKIMEEINKGCDKMIINFSEVIYISSAGLQVLISATKYFAKNSSPFAVCSIDEKIMKVFEISGLRNHFTIYNDLETGINSLKD